jgi:diacylglycerol kinase family enzyme
MQPGPAIKQRRDARATVSLPLFVNATAGRRGSASPGRVEAACRAHGVACRTVQVEPARLGESVGHAAGQHPLIGVAGGDGSLRAAAAALAGRDSALVPFPTGTLNHFARRHGFNTVDHGAAAAAGGQVRQVPLGVLDDEFFLNTATFGYYSEVVRRRERLRPWLGKWPAAAVAIGTLLLKMPRFEVELEFEGRSIYRRTALVWIGVGWGSFPRAHEAVDRRATPDLEVAVLRAGSRAAMLGFGARLVPQLFRSERPMTDPALEIHHARSVLIRGAHRLHVTMDGERFRFRPPVYVGVQDDGLRMVIAPPPS